MDVSRNDILGVVAASSRTVWTAAGETMMSKLSPGAFNWPMQLPDRSVTTGGTSWLPSRGKVSGWPSKAGPTPQTTATNELKISTFRSILPSPS